MTLLIICLLAIAVLALIIKFIKYAASLYIALACICILGIPVALFNMQLGIYMFICGALGCILLFFVTYIAAVISGLFALFVITPLAGIWFSIRTLFFKIRK